MQSLHESASFIFRNECTHPTATAIPTHTSYYSYFRQTGILGSHFAPDPPPGKARSLLRCPRPREGLNIHFYRTNTTHTNAAQD